MLQEDDSFDLYGNYYKAVQEEQIRKFKYDLNNRQIIMYDSLEKKN